MHLSEEPVYDLHDSVMIIICHNDVAQVLHFLICISHSHRKSRRVQHVYVIIRITDCNRLFN